eukprot:TRINITY_DN4983_c0_g1_i1.p1 TRINITY_DN4983_c0_g1~~TRINITY_DN4983_c0_g1_i1.p1  ORF type:complete len:875 (-),score=90.09 TRINITY_DN4983_c0_g1_i1:294-2645(-)
MINQILAKSALTSLQQSRVLSRLFCCYTVQRIHEICNLSSAGLTMSGVPLTTPENGQGGSVVWYFEKNPPLALVGAQKLAGVGHIDFKVDPKATKDFVVKLQHYTGDDIEGPANILRFIARLSTNESYKFYGSDALTATQIDQWLDLCMEVIQNGPGLQSACESLNDYLALRTFLVGYSLSIADLCAWGQLHSAMQWQRLRKQKDLQEKLVHLNRWFDFMNEQPTLKEVVAEFGTGRAAKKEADKKKKEEGNNSSVKAGDTAELVLPGAVKGKVVTRFPPEPSGYLHIGHAKAAMLNQYFSETYEGKLLVRFDDTNPSKEKDEFVDNILTDIKTLGLRYCKLTYTSDYFDMLEEATVNLIKQGMMYADDTPTEQMRDERMKGIESKCKNRSVEENLKIWEEMLKGSKVGLDNCLRMKMDMSSDNGTMRDPVMYRCNLDHHWRTGSKHKAYPTYDFACPFVDSYEGVTHALRSSEYRDREEQYYWILKAHQKVNPTLPNVHVWDFSRLNFVNTVLSKRKLKWFVETGRVAGWNDPRFPTVQGMVRRGLTIEALKQFILMQGASKNVTLQEWDKIWSINKQLIDPVCPRHTAVEELDKVPMFITNAPDEPEIVIIPKHKKYEAAGKKATTRSKNIWLDQVDAKELNQDEEVTLMDWGNCYIRKIVRDESSQKVTSLEGELHLEGSVKTTKWKLTWLPQTEELVPLTLKEFGFLITKPKFEDDDNIEDFVNENSESTTVAIGDSNMRTLQRGEIIQLERKGYYRVDEPYLKKDQPMILFNIPDGKK